MNDVSTDLNLRGSHLQSQVNRVCQKMMLVSMLVSMFTLRAESLLSLFSLSFITRYKAYTLRKGSACRVDDVISLVCFVMSIFIYICTV